MMNKYEIMYIIHPNLDEAQSKEVVEKFNGIITADGSKLLEVKDWGLRDLAYEIKKVNKGHYIILKVEASIEALNEFDRLALIDSNIIRHIIIKEEE